MDTKNKTIVLFTFSLATFFISFMIQALNLALPEIGREFGADAILLNWAVLVYSLSVAAFSVPFGRIADIVGIKKIILIGLITLNLLPIEMMPNISLGYITINIDVRGGIPANVIEKSICKPVEEADSYTCGTMCICHKECQDKPYCLKSQFT